MSVNEYRKYELSERVSIIRRQGCMRANEYRSTVARPSLYLWRIMTCWASESSPLNTTLPLLTTCSSASLVMFLTPGRRSHMLSAGLLRTASITSPA